MGSSQGLTTFVGRNFSWWNPGAKLPRVHQFSLGFQLRTTRNSSLDLSYVGSRTQNLMTSLARNNPTRRLYRHVRSGPRWPPGELQRAGDQSLPRPGRIRRNRARHQRANLQASDEPAVSAVRRRSAASRAATTARMWYNSAQAVYRINLAAA